MPMFVYRPQPKIETAYIDCGCSATVLGGKQFAGTVTDVDCGSTVTAEESIVAKNPTAGTFSAASLATVFGNRFFSSVNVDCSSEVTISFIPITNLSIYNENSFVGTTKKLNFSGSVVSKASDVITTTDGDSLEYALRVDQVNATLMYKAEAAIGSSDSAAVWRISRIVFGNDGDVTTTWAGGTSDFDKVWDDRLILSYS